MRWKHNSRHSVQVFPADLNTSVGTVHVIYILAVVSGTNVTPPRKRGNRDCIWIESWQIVTKSTINVSLQIEKKIYFEGISFHIFRLSL